MLPSLRKPTLPLVSPFLDKRHGTARRGVEWISLRVRAHKSHVCRHRVEDGALSSITSHRIVRLSGPHLFSFASRVASNRRWSALDSASGVPAHARILDVGRDTARGVRHYQKLRFCAMGIDGTPAVLRMVRECGTAAPHKVGKAYRIPIAFPGGNSATPSVIPQVFSSRHSTMPRQIYWVLWHITFPISARTDAVTEMIRSVRFATCGDFRK
jgi:hypothetical protein